MNGTGQSAKGPLLAAESVTRILAGTVPVTLVSDASLSVNAGEFIAITGPSGSGKSSLLYLLGLLDRPSEGRVLIDGRDTAEMSKAELAEIRLSRIGFVFQFHFLLPEFTVLDNVLLPMRRLGALSSRQMKERASDILGSVGLADKRDRRPDQLSGGERQRVAVARALANDPPLVLADEPTGSLDTKNGAMVFDIFMRMVSDGAKTVIAVTHETELAARADRQVRLLDGRIVEDTARAGSELHAAP